MNISRAEKRGKVGDCLGSWVFCFCKVGDQGGGVILWFISLFTSIWLLPITCSKTTNRFASPHGPGRFCPSMWTDTVRSVCIIRLVAFGLLCSRRGTREKPQTDSAGSWTPHLLHCLTGIWGGRDFRNKDVALTVKSMDLLLFLPHLHW